MTKKIPLTDDQYSRLWQDKVKTAAIGSVLAAMVNKLAEQVARDDEKFWDSVELLADAKQKFCKVDWINRCIIVEELGSD